MRPIQGGLRPHDVIVYDFPPFFSSEIKNADETSRGSPKHDAANHQHKQLLEPDSCQQQPASSLSTSRQVASHEKIAL